ncbi:nuclear transport factor 2 family protein [Streptomyces sp. NPDC001177]
MGAAYRRIATSVAALTAVIGVAAAAGTSAGATGRDSSEKSTSTVNTVSEGSRSTYHLSYGEAANTKAAVALLVGAFTEHHPRTYALRYIDAETYIQHNPNYDNGRDAFIRGVGDFVKRFPQSCIVVKRTLAQGDLVVVQTLFKATPDDRGTAVVDTFRFNSRGKAVEHWDVLQAIAPTTANGNPQI